MKNPYTVYWYTLNLALQVSLFTLPAWSQNPELLKEISPYEGGNPSNFTLFKDKVYFSAVERIDFRIYTSSLWVTDGTPLGTTRVKACNPSMRFYTQPFVTTQNLMFFIGNDPANGQELWVSDGTANGTRMLKNINPNGDTRFEEFIVFKGKVYFSANDGRNDALWVSDGTATGTYKIKDFPHPNFAYIRPTAFVLFDDRLFFHFDDTNDYTQFWETDGTATGTKRLNTGQDFRSPAQEFRKVKDKIVFRSGADLKVLTKDSLLTLGKLSGGTCLNAESQVIVFKDTLYFQGEEDALYRSDGTPQGTQAIFTANSICHFLEANGALYFAVSSQLWTTNGTSTGTKAVAQNSPPYNISDQASSMFVYQNKIYFNAFLFPPPPRPRLFVYDPVADTAVPFISALPNEFYAYGFFIFNNRLYFRGPNLNPATGPDPESPTALWQTDGTLAGTSSVSPLNINDRARIYDYLFNAKGYLFFANADNSYWYTGGTQANTRLIRPNGVDKFLSNQERVYILYKDYFIFRGNFSSEYNNEELWVLKLNNLTTSSRDPQNPELDQISIYPNPAQNTLQLNDHQLGDTYDLQLYNLLSQPVASFTGVKSHQSLPIAQLNSGVYWAKISNGQRKWTTKKVVIAH